MIGSSVNQEFPTSNNKEAFKPHQKEFYKIKGMYKEGFRAKNNKINIKMNHN